jgi:hypothetical protein
MHHLILQDDAIQGHHENRSHQLHKTLLDTADLCARTLILLRDPQNFTKEEHVTELDVLRAKLRKSYLVNNNNGWGSVKSLTCDICLTHRKKRWSNARTVHRMEL